LYTGHTIENLIQRSIATPNEYCVIASPSRVCGSLARVSRCHRHHDIHGPDAFPQLLIERRQLGCSRI
jgi:hypothetical protein